MLIKRLDAMLVVQFKAQLVILAKKLPKIYACGGFCFIQSKFDNQNNSFNRKITPD